MRGVDYEKMGKRVRQYRKKAGLTQQQVAETIEIEASNMSHIERGKIKTSLNTITMIANVLGVTLDMLVCDSLDFVAVPYHKEFVDILSDCNARELRIFTETIQVLKKELRA